jgi:hypothetical protein
MWIHIKASTLSLKPHFFMPMPKVNPRQQHRQLRWRDFQPLRITARRPAEAPLFQSLRKHPYSAAIPVKDLQPIPAFVRKHKQTATERVRAKTTGRLRPQPVKTLAHVHGRHRQADFRLGWKVEHLKRVANGSVVPALRHRRRAIPCRPQEPPQDPTHTTSQGKESVHGTACQ